MKWLSGCATLGCVLLAGFFLVCADAAEKAKPEQRARRGWKLPHDAYAMLLRIPAIQQEIGLTEEQKGKLTPLGEELRGLWGQNIQNLSREDRQALVAKAAEIGQKAEAILVPEQQQRLQQISLQIRGAAALSDPSVAEELKLTDEQKQKINALREKVQAAMKEAGLRPGVDKQSLSEEERKAVREKMEKVNQLRKEILEEALKVLTPEQSAAFEKMKGEKFDLSQMQGGKRGEGKARGKRKEEAPSKPK